MNILVMSWRDPKNPLAGGAEQVMHEHMKGWVAAGHKVTLFSARIIGHVKKENHNGIEIIRKGDQYIGVKLAAFFYYLKNKEKFDLVVDQFHGIPFFTPLYVRKPKIAVLQEIAKEVWFLNGFPFPANYIIGTIGFLVEPLIFLFYKKVPFMVGSASAKNDLEKMGISKNHITIVPHGVIIPKSKIQHPKSKIKTVMYLGAISKDKGIEDAIRAFSILNKQGDYQFWIAGKGAPPYIESLMVLIKDLRLTNKVKFWGFVDDKKKFELLARAHVLINPSVREGWGLVNIEANAMGTPVVAYKSAGLVDSVKEGQSGIVVGKNTPGKIAEAIVFMLSDEKLFLKFQDGAISWSKKFSWIASREKSLKLLRNAI